MRTATKLLAPFAAAILFASALDAASFREHLDERERRPSVVHIPPTNGSWRGCAQ
jgi:hypothetical protein